MTHPGWHLRGAARVVVEFEGRLQDGKGFNVQLNALPVAGKLVLRAHQPKPEG